MLPMLSSLVETWRGLRRPSFPRRPPPLPLENYYSQRETPAAQNGVCVARAPACIALTPWPTIRAPSSRSRRPDPQLPRRKETLFGWLAVTFAALRPQRETPRERSCVPLLEAPSGRRRRRSRCLRRLFWWECKASGSHRSSNDVAFNSGDDSSERIGRVLNQSLRCWPEGSRHVSPLTASSSAILSAFSWAITVSIVSWRITSSNALRISCCRSFGGSASTSQD